MARERELEGDTASNVKAGQTQIAQLQKKCSEAMLDVHKELLGAYAEAIRAWVARVKDEVEMWPKLAAELSTARSISKATAIYTHCVSQRMQMAVDDGRRLFEQTQKIVGAMTRTVSRTRST
jgi:hypothetical protein